MSKIQFKPPYSLENLPPVKVTRMTDLDALIKDFEELRAQLAHLAEERGESVYELKVSAGLLCEDFGELLGIGPLECSPSLENVFCVKGTLKAEIFPEG